MVKKELKLDYIEIGRLSNNEMNEFYGGEIVCGNYTACKKKKGNCDSYFNCIDPYMPGAPRNFCGAYTWVSENFELDALEIN